MNAGVRHAIITGDDHGALLAMITWFLGCALLLCIGTRIGLRFSTRRLPDVDDWLIWVAAAFAMGGTIAVSLAVYSGLGKRASLLNTANIEHIQKVTYAATILYVLTVGVSKLCITTFLARLACTPIHKNAVTLLGILVACWTTAITIVVVFQCTLPRPWAVWTGKCISMFPFWLSASIIDMVTDIIMILLPVHIVSGLQLPLRKKAVIVFIFALRLLLIALSTARIILLHYSLRNDFSFDSIPYFTTTQAHATVSVIIACSPALKPFMDNVRTGMLGASLAKHEQGTTFGQDSYNMQVVTKGSLASKWKRRSEASRRPSDNPGTQHSSASRGADKQYVYVPYEQERSVAQRLPISAPLSDIEMGRPRRPSTVLSNQHSVDSLRSRMHASPPLPPPRPPTRPPPPPEELRPDLSLFVSQVGTSSVIRGGRRGGESRGEILSKERGSEESIGSGKGNIRKTQGWDVKFDNY